MKDKTSNKLDDLKVKKEEVLKGGGKERIARHKKLGKLTARERIISLLDEGSFVELDPFREHEVQDFGMEDKKYPGDDCPQKEFKEEEVVFKNGEEITMKLAERHLELSRHFW